MKIFLMWRPTGGPGQGLDPERVAADLWRIFSPLSATLPEASIRQTAAVTMVYLETPLRGWKPPFLQEDAQTWAHALEYPINARTALAANGIGFRDDNILPTLCRKLQDNPTPFLREMAPPFSLVWSAKRTGEIFIQNDGLGQAQLFEYQGDRLWALTNRIFALKALGITLEADSEQWAARSTLGWFPLSMTGYKRISFLEPGTRIRVDSKGLNRTTHDVLSEWVNPATRSKDDCLDLARSSLLNLIKEVMPLWDRPSVGLSGGWDSRAVVSSLRALGAEFSLRVRGLPDRPDVVISTELARIAGLDLQYDTSGGLPPDHADGCRRCVSRALLWQAGHMDTSKHKSFLAQKEHLGSGGVKLMGLHGGIGKATYANMIRVAELQANQYEERFVEKMMSRMPPFVRKDLHNRVRDIVLEAYRQADRYGLTGLARLNFFKLYERNRRWASGAINSQTNLVITPFLNPDFIRACYAYPGQDLATKPFHRHIIATNAPDWVHVPFEDDFKKSYLANQKVQSATELGKEINSSSTWKKPKGNAKYHKLLYWKMVGEPLISKALAQGGFWTEIFEPDLAEKQWQAAPDALTMLYLLPHVLDT